MGVPSKRRPKNRQRTSNNPANHVLAIKETNLCPKCGKMKLQHRACKFCGAYKAESKESK